MSERVDRVGPAGAVHFDAAGDPPPRGECPWCGAECTAKGECSARCERSRQRVDRFSGGQLDVCTHGVVRARCTEGCA